MSIENINVEGIKVGEPYYWNVAWYVPVNGIELKFKQKDRPKNVDILKVYNSITAPVDVGPDREMIIRELKSTILENEIEPIELFDKSIIDKVVK